MSHVLNRSAAAFLLPAIFSVTSAQAMTSSQMMQECRIRAGHEFRTRLPNIDTKYEGQRVDGTHAVNGTAIFDGRTETFQCSFNRSGNKIIKFVVNKKSGSATQGPDAPSYDAKVPGTDFNATGYIPCARYAGQPMASCKVGVKRDGKGNGTVTDAPSSYDESQADGGAKMRTEKNSDLFTVTIGSERFEIPEAVMAGG
ncbi:MAG: hypothetical protein AB7S74_11005 [Hyphomicrobium sp.]